MKIWTNKMTRYKYSGMNKYHKSDNALRDIKNINWVVFDKVCRWDLSSTEEIRNNT